MLKFDESEIILEIKYKEEKHYPELNEDEIIEVSRNFIIKKYGEDGYTRTKMYLDDIDYKK